MSLLRLALAPLLATALAGAAPKASPVDLVNPFIGTGGHGHTFPGPSLPFGMVQLSPDTRLTGWDGCSGYHATDSVIYGFSHTHLSGTGCSDYGDVLLLPATGPVKLETGYRDEGDHPRRDPAGYGSRFRKDHEKASPGYYAVELDDYGVKAELTATLRAGLHRYTFSRTDNAHVLLDLTHRDRVLESSLRVVDDHTLEGMRRSQAWAQDQPVYFVIRFSRPFLPALAVDGKLQEGLRTAAGTDLKAVLRFKLAAGDTVLAKVGISAVDPEGARRNLGTEIPGWSFDNTRALARAAWSKALAKAQVQGGTADQRVEFATALYHTFLQPAIFTDVDGRYLGRDLKIHKADGYVQHTIFSLWDTFRAANPLYTLLEGHRVRDFVRTFLAQYEQGGFLPVWELWGNETGCMIGNHAIPVIVDAYLKGIRDFDAEEAFAAMKKSATAHRLGLDAYERDGYIASDQANESVSRTLEYAYDDGCIARMAKALGKAEDCAFFLKRSQAYQHLLDPATGLVRPKTNAKWKTPFDPAEVDFNFTEGNAWQYSFFVPQDVAGHMARLGGPAAYAAKLDALFSAPSRTTGREQSDITGLIGQYAHGNEPSHHMAYLYAYAGMPWKTQALVRRLMEEMYRNDPEGLIGNEDCGQMSAWFVLSACGFYPVNPCGGEYVIGTPLFDSATLNLENGRKFTVRRKGAAGPYIQSATFNGRPWKRSWIRHEEILKGGELVFTMGAEPNRAWGSAEGDRPVSAITEFKVQAVPFVVSGDARFSDRTTVALASPLAGARIHYTLDGTVPTEGSALYTAPLTFTDSVTLRFMAFTEGLPPSPVAEARFQKWVTRGTLRLGTRYGAQYAAGGDQALVDGVRGGQDFRLGSWQGYLGVDLDATLDLGSEQEFHRVALGCLQEGRSWALMPAEVTVEAGDGEHWFPLGRARNPVDPRQEGTVTRDFVVEFPALRARYLRVRAKNPGPCPAGTWGAGNPSWIFVDEIVVE